MGFWPAPQGILARDGGPEGLWMRYTVVWLPRALGALTNLWLQAPDQQAVADASDRLDIALANDPQAKGKPLGKFFVREDAPLSVLYHVAPGDRMVRIMAVKRIP